MEISMGMAEALARFAYVQSRLAETTKVRENDQLISMLQGERVQRHGWHPPS